VEGGCDRDAMTEALGRVKLGMPAEAQLTSGDEGPEERGELEDSYNAAVKRPLEYPPWFPYMSGEDGGEEDMIEEREALDGSALMVVVLLLGGLSIGFDTNCDFNGKRRVRVALLSI
jgi:hypothetical protein